MSERMNIYLTAGKRSFFYCYPAIKSLFVENQDSEIYLYIVSEDLEESDICNEKKLAAEYGHRIIILHFDVNKAKENIICKNPDHWPLGTLGCYWMFHELLPEDVDRILAIEADTVTVGPVSEYYHTDLTGYYAASPGPEHKPESHRKLMERLGGDTLTFVMSLYNVKAIREAFTVDDILRADAKVVEQFGHSQQELTFGILFRNRIKFIPGVTTCVEENRQALKALGYDYVRKCEKTCKILHFSSSLEKEKPWNPVCVMPGYAVWWKYAEESPYYQQYIESQWGIFDKKEEKNERLKKNITYRNVLGMTMVVVLFLISFIGMMLFQLKINFVFFVVVCFIVSSLFVLLFRKFVIWISRK